MPAYFIDGVFTDAQPAWHGAGTVLDESAITYEDVETHVPLIASPVERMPLLATRVTDTGGVDVLDIDDFYATVRTADRHVLGVVGSRYRVVQNEALFRLGEQIIAREGEAVWKTAGIIGEREQTVWGLLDLGGFDVAGEDWKKYLMVTNTHDGSRQLEVVCTDVRVVCWNTWNAAIDGASRRYTVRHTQSVNGLADAAARALGISARFDKTLQELGSELSGRRMASDAFQTFAADLIPYDPDAFKESGVADRKRHVAFVDDSRGDLVHVWENAPNLEGIRSTAWGAMQATIEWQQRYAYPDRIPATRVRKCVEDVAVNTRALELLAKV